MRFSKLSLQSLLMLVCVTIAIVPLTALSVVMWRTTYAMEESSLAEFNSVAVNIGDKIDRNLFERYGDVQAFGLNSVSTDKSHWYEQGESNPIVEAMNRYVDTYDIYYLTLLVDLKGKLIAVNTRDDSGNQLVTEGLIMGVFLIIGLLTPLSAAVAWLFVVNLFLASFGTGEWPWIYIIMGVVLAVIALTRSGRSFGLDAWLVKKWGEPPIPYLW